jgi:leucyl-tRNA synthetase
VQADRQHGCCHRDCREDGFDTGLRARHPFLPGVELPVHVANFVLMEYGLGAIFGCPAHDQRDLDFARKYGLPVLPVVIPEGTDPATFAVGEEAYTGEGRLANSGFLDGLTVEAAKAAVTARLEAEGAGTKTVTYRLRDWASAGSVTGAARSPSSTARPAARCRCRKRICLSRFPMTPRSTFRVIRSTVIRHGSMSDCPSCGKAARRETDTMDTFVDLSWYFARFCDAKAEGPTNLEAVNYWLPVEQVSAASSTRSCICSMRAFSCGR